MPPAHLWMEETGSGVTHRFGDNSHLVSMRHPNASYRVEVTGMSIEGMDDLVRRAGPFRPMDIIGILSHRIIETVQGVQR